MRPLPYRSFLNSVRQIQQRLSQRARRIHLQMHSDLKSACKFPTLFGQKLSRTVLPNKSSLE